MWCCVVDFWIFQHILIFLKIGVRFRIIVAGHEDRTIAGKWTAIAFIAAFRKGLAIQFLGLVKSREAVFESCGKSASVVSNVASFTNSKAAGGPSWNKAVFWD